MTQIQFSMEKDFLASCIRSVIDRLKNVLSAIEEGESIDNEFAGRNIEAAIGSLRQVRGWKH